MSHKSVTIWKTFYKGLEMPVSGSNKKPNQYEKSWIKVLEFLFIPTIESETVLLEAALVETMLLETVLLEIAINWWTLLNATSSVLLKKAKLKKCVGLPTEQEFLQLYQTLPFPLDFDCQAIRKMSLKTLKKNVFEKNGLE